MIKRKSKKGLTLVELLMAMGLFSVVVLLISGLYLFTNKNIIIWQDKAFLNSQILLVCGSLRSSLGRLMNFNTVESTKLIFQQHNNKRIEIEYGDDQIIRRNGIDIISNDCIISNFNFSFLSIAEEGGELVIKRDNDMDKNHNFRLENEELDLINAIEFNLTVNYKNYSKQINQIVTLRNYLNK